jgi:hypothetical protein
MQPTRSSRITLTIGALLGAVAIAASARAAEGPPPRHQPPPEAFTACQGKSESDSCSVSLPDRTVAGTCAASPEGTLFCRPARPPEAR